MKHRSCHRVRRWSKRWRLHSRTSSASLLSCDISRVSYIRNIPKRRRCVTSYFSWMSENCVSELRFKLFGYLANVAFSTIFGSVFIWWGVRSWYFYTYQNILFFWQITSSRVMWSTLFTCRKSVVKVFLALCLFWLIACKLRRYHLWLSACLICYASCYVLCRCMFRNSSASWRNRQTNYQKFSAKSRKTTHRLKSSMYVIVFLPTNYSSMSMSFLTSKKYQVIHRS